MAYDVDILTTSSGDEAVTAGDDWVTFDNQADNDRPGGRAGVAGRGGAPHLDRGDLRDVLLRDGLVEHRATAR